MEHIAFILDGNGRWAKARKKQRTYGHKIGMKNILPTILSSKKLEIKYITMFCFSTENWNRPDGEVNYLMNFPSEIFSKKQQEQYVKEGIKIVWIGRRSKVPLKTKEILEEIEEKTKKCDQIVVHIALDYGSFEEIENAFKIVFSDINNKKILLEDFTVQTILDNLYTKKAPPVDLLIRTGGEKRLSNFMLLQLAYAEFYFIDQYWPDFKEKDLKLAIEYYNNRNRRFGEIKNEN
ncbi:polyprenyl diphosphate synthase [Spiroplasma floricola]|uniref:Isoprenyl transferase n=1 Tax=Spiroplasma floricola 23-6 TaxID=1336749 RepID=A0A2K8SER8_9MOLU|nr:polyprenyl diphosphate synthase [Spiroplasma floricola]AUB31845.1 undecaprenyl pyrophosphate synthase [Spiroplasma floricola 23-6]